MWREEPPPNRYRVVIAAVSLPPKTFADRTAAEAYREGLRALGVGNETRVQVRTPGGEWVDDGQPEGRS